MQSDPTSKLEVQKSHQEHLDSAEKFYADLKFNTDWQKQNSVLTLTFDFHQNLPLFHIPIGELFYMQQLWLYVFGVHSCSDNRVRMYCWLETLAKKGSDEVISCLQHFLSQIPATIKTLSLF